jgi:sensor c-di-GMP phosphodiesterase-like protein
LLLQAGLLKIDRSLVNGIGHNPAIPVTAAMAMVQSLRLKTLSEGVETAQQAGSVRTAASPPGFYYSEAVPADSFTELLRRQFTGRGLALAAVGSACAFEFSRYSGQAFRSRRAPSKVQG